jgi:thiamine-monophosphate kinase
MDLRELGERASIKRLREVLGTTDDLGRGEDDCAVVPLGGGKVLLASTDVLIGPTHIFPGTPPEQFGAFAIEIAISDVAAMGGRPIGVLTAMAMPPETDIEWLRSVSAGMAKAAGEHGTTVLGGDTKSSPARTVAVTAMGVMDEERCLYRRGGRPGDVLVLTGSLGGPALGYTMAKDSEGGYTPEALSLLYDIKARTDAGLALAASGHANACIDLSDGFAPALHQMLEASGCGALVEWGSVPLAPGLSDLVTAQGLDIRELALHWGGEYELLAAVDPAGVDEVLTTLHGLGGEARPVGELASGREILLVHDGSPAPLGPKGFDHFRGV